MKTSTRITLAIFISDPFSGVLSVFPPHIMQISLHPRRMVINSTLTGKNYFVIVVLKHADRCGAIFPVTGWNLS